MSCFWNAVGEHGRDIEDWLEAEKELNELAEIRAGETELAADLEPLPNWKNRFFWIRQAAAAGLDVL